MSFVHSLAIQAAVIQDNIEFKHILQPANFLVQFVMGQSWLWKNFGISSILVAIVLLPSILFVYP